jgi:fused signal recognition particle receptor
MFNFLKNQFTKLTSQFSRITSFFGRAKIDESALKELETILIQADTGPKTTAHILDQVRSELKRTDLSGAQLKKILGDQLKKLLLPFEQPVGDAVYLLVGINGSGKTTFAGKLASAQAKKGNAVYLVAADTFRAAAREQLQSWAQKAEAHLIEGKPEQDPASVVFVGCEQYKKEKGNVLIIDTAGRLQTKTHLMNELSKIKRIIERQLPNHRIITLLTIDSMLGQNSFQQAKLFHESTTIDGIVLTKVDGTGKGGAVFAISTELKLPVAYISSGESIDQVAEFNPQQFIDSLFST